MKYKLLCCLFSVFYLYRAKAQTEYQNKIFKSYIKTVECYNSSKEQSLPVINLKSSETITFAFDDLRGGQKNYSYTIEHCTWDWKPSRMNLLDYLEGVQQDILFNYRYSFNTLVKFTHYQLTFPNEQMKPKVGGNYILKIYDDNDPSKVAITQRFYVLNSTFNIGAEVVPATDVADRNSKQKINFSIFHQTAINNPYLEVKAVVMQNAIPQTAIVNTKPSFVKPGTLVYNDINTNQFWAGNEFRKFDTRSFRYKAEHVADIYRDSTQNVILSIDLPNNSTRYSNQFDENGNFFIRNTDGRDNVTDSDYAYMLFTLAAPPPTPKGNVYVFGRFNNYALTADNMLTFESSRRRFYGNIKLKQGLYDFKYVWVDENGKFNDTVFEGSFFETENAYQIFAYYRRPGARYDDLVGFANVNSVKR
ncbi:type IX secretion system plug protein [Pedobacter nanyangensis]|uniref:type IX secretion system plug protein n=1 Tax=Pedobacter nanyangensis TaxID=1562389 RepID=UPI000DE3030C|nr:DUF5103 domain-containing protein [Pedobacter nanyangensis]